MFEIAPRPDDEETGSSTEHSIVSAWLHVPPKRSRRNGGSAGRERERARGDQVVAVGVPPHVDPLAGWVPPRWVLPVVLMLLCLFGVVAAALKSTSRHNTSSRSDSHDNDMRAFEAKRFLVAIQTNLLHFLDLLSTIPIRFRGSKSRFMNDPELILKTDDSFPFGQFQQASDDCCYQIHD